MPEPYAPTPPGGPDNATGNLAMRQYVESLTTQRDAAVADKETANAKVVIANSARDEKQHLVWQIGEMYDEASDERDSALASLGSMTIERDAAVAQEQLWRAEWESVTETARVLQVQRAELQTIADAYQDRLESIETQLLDSQAQLAELREAVRVLRAVADAARKGIGRSEACGSCDAGLPMNCTCNEMDAALAALATSATPTEPRA